MGWACTILSLEPESADEGSLARLERRVDSSGIRWRHRPYRWGRREAIRNVLSMTGMIREVRKDTDLFHCRSYFGAFFPAVLDVFRGCPYVFDTRGYWVDEKMEAGRWFQDSATRRVARHVERELYERAGGVVSLTELAAEDVRRGRFGRPHPEERSICIPTCVDYSKFRIERGEPPRHFLRDGPIIAYVGSLNPSYEYRASLQLVRLALLRSPKAKFLALTSQISEMSSLADEFSIPENRRLITSVGHEEIHRWLPWVDLGLMLLVSPNEAKRASMPTKLGEFLATGVAPIAYGGNTEVTDWVKRAGSGVVLDDLSDESLAWASVFAGGSVPGMEVLMRARAAAEKHFSLDSGAKRYDTLFCEVLTTKPRTVG